MQSVNKVNLTNLKSCNQVWDNMIPSEKGRICRKCQNDIIDFRDMSDKEIAEFHVFTEGKVCGLYNIEQLNPKSRKNKKRGNKSIFLGIMGLLSTLNGNSQTKITVVPVEQIEKDYELIDFSKRKSQNQFVNDSIIVSGRLIDESGEALIFANVHIKGTKIGTTTDIEGKYNLDIFNQIDSTDEITLVYSYVGYNNHEEIIRSNDILENKLILDIQLDQGDGIIEFYITVEKQPLHKRMWNRFKRIFRRKNK